MSLEKFRKIVNLAEAAREKLMQEPLPYGRDDLDPVKSKDSIDYHYGTLAKSYVNRYNKKEGDDQFNYGGATLHNLYFPQLRPPRSGNRPTGASKDVIDAKWGSFDEFKQAIEKEAMAIQGSGWVYMDLEGALHTILNHEYKKSIKIALLIDWWEHAWFTDYGPDKAKYLNNIWRIIDWTVINDRLQGESHGS